MELGLHIADFTWTGGTSALVPALARHVREAEAAGIRRISVMDHFWQIRGAGAGSDAAGMKTRAVGDGTGGC